MRVWFVMGCFGLLFSHFAFANCQSEKKYDVQNHYEACSVRIEKPNYSVNAEISGELTEADCDSFCSQFSIVIVPHGDHVHTPVVPIALVQRWEGTLAGLGLNLAPEIMISQMFAGMLAIQDQIMGNGDAANALFEQYTQAHIPQRKDDQILKPSAYEVVLKSELPVDAKCTICQEKFADVSEDVQAVKLKACGHTYCKGCIEEEFHYRSSCPLCRGALLAAEKPQEPGPGDK